MGNAPRTGRNTDDRMPSGPIRPLTAEEELNWFRAVRRDYYRYLATLRVLHRRRVMGNYVVQAERTLRSIQRLIEEIAHLPVVSQAKRHEENKQLRRAAFPEEPDPELEGRTDGP